MKCFGARQRTSGRYALISTVTNIRSGSLARHARRAAAAVWGDGFSVYVFCARSIASPEYDRGPDATGRMEGGTGLGVGFAADRIAIRLRAAS